MFLDFLFKTNIFTVDGTRKARPHIMVGKNCLFKSIGDLGAPRNSDYSEVHVQYMSNVSVVGSWFKISRYLLQLFRKVPQHCIALQLRKHFVLTINLKRGWIDNAVIFIFGWIYPSAVKWKVKMQIVGSFRNQFVLFFFGFFGFSLVLHTGKNCLYIKSGNFSGESRCILNQFYFLIWNHSFYYSLASKMKNPYSWLLTL